MRLTRLFGVLALAAVLAASGADDGALRDWKRETAEKQAAKAKVFTSLMEGVDALEVFTLDAASGRDREEERAKDNSPRLHRWKITRQIKVTDAQEIARLRTGIRRSIETAEGASPCFEPRHGVRFTKNGRQVELILCFECSGMEASGSPEFDGAMISPAAETEFYRVFRAHGLTKPNRLNGMTDAEVAKRLPGSWTSAGKGRSGKALVESASDETYAADGRYRTKGRTTIRFDDGQQTEHAHEETGRWRIEDGMLFTLSDPSEDMTLPVPIEFARPVLEVTPNRVVFGTISLEAPDHESIWMRK